MSKSPHSPKVILKVNRKRALQTLNWQVSLSDSLGWRNMLGILVLTFSPRWVLTSWSPLRREVGLPGPWGLPVRTGDQAQSWPLAENALTAHPCTRIPASSCLQDNSEGEERWFQGHSTLPGPSSTFKASPPLSHLRPYSLSAGCTPTFPFPFPSQGSALWPSHDSGASGTGRSAILGRPEDGLAWGPPCPVPRQGGVLSHPGPLAGTHWH